MTYGKNELIIEAKRRTKQPIVFREINPKRCLIADMQQLVKKYGVGIFQKET